MSITQQNTLGDFDLLDELTQSEDMTTLLTPQTAIMIAYSCILFGFMRLKADPTMGWVLILLGVFSGISMIFYIKYTRVKSIASNRYIISHTYYGDYDADEQLEIEGIVTILSPDEDGELGDYQGEDFEELLEVLSIDKTLEAPTIQEMLQKAIEKRAIEFYEQTDKVSRFKAWFKGLRKKENNTEGEIINERGNETDRGTDEGLEEKIST